MRCDVSDYDQRNASCLLQEQPNTDLLVDDKYTGKIAYRVAQAKAADIDRYAPAFCGDTAVSVPATLSMHQCWRAVLSSASAHCFSLESEWTC